MFTWVDVCSTQPLCRGIQSAFRRVTHQRPRRRRRRRRRVYFGPFRNNPENNEVDQIVTRPVERARGGGMPPCHVCSLKYQQTVPTSSAFFAEKKLGLAV